MIVESPDIFRQWLTAVLEPLCDADPAALARYVHALVKKEKPIEELRATMIDQLDVFLQAETQSFVALLFKTLENKEYLNYKKEAIRQEASTTAAAEPTQNNQTVGLVNQPAATSQAVVGPAIPVAITTPEQQPEPSPINSSLNADHAVKDRDMQQIQSSVVSDSTSKNDEAIGGVVHKRDDRRDSRDDRSRPPRTSRKERSRSRSPWERDPAPNQSRIRRDRSRERGPRDHRSDRSRAAYRGSSPPPTSHHRRYDRDRRYSSRSPNYRGDRASRSKSPRSPPRARNRFRSRSPHARSRSQSPSYDKKRKVSPGKEVDLRSQIGSNRRCRDYELKGYCMAGDRCPYDHGSDPVVLRDLQLPTMLTFTNAGTAAPATATVPPAHPPMVPPPPFLPPSAAAVRPPMPPAMMMRPPPTMEYNPEAPALNPHMNWGRPPFHTRGIHPHHPHHPPHHPLHPRGIMPGPGGNYHGNNSRDLIIPVHVDRHHNYNNNCLDILKIPPPLNNITHLNNHFAKFGKIINIQVNYNNDPESAMITFSSPAEAYAAYRSTEAVLNNRFIRVVWHGNNQKSGGAGGGVRDRLGPPPSNDPNSGTDGSKKDASDGTVGNANAKTEGTKKLTPEEEKAKALAAIKENQALLEKNKLLRQKTEDTLKKRVEITSELTKRSAQLMEKQIEQQKELLKKLETGDLDEKQKTLIKDTIKMLQESIEKIRKDLLTVAQKPAKKTRDEVEKEILDTELDLITRQQEGGDLLPLQKKLGQLKLELARFEPKIIPGSVAKAHNMIIRTATTLIKNPSAVLASRLHHHHLHHHNQNSLSHNLTLIRNAKITGGQTKLVDHRPTKLLISGYEQDEKDQVLAHFKQFGEIVHYISDDSTPSIVLNFKTRAEAEAAMANGKNFQDRTLTATWFNTNQIGNRRRQSSASGPTYHMHAGRQVLLSGSEADLEVDQENDPDSEIDPIPDSSDDLLLQDDDEDAEDEERSWRR